MYVKDKNEEECYLRETGTPVFLHRWYSIEGVEANAQQDPQRPEKEAR